MPEACCRQYNYPRPVIPKVPKEPNTSDVAQILALNLLNSKACLSALPCYRDASAAQCLRTAGAYMIRRGVYSGL